MQPSSSMSRRAILIGAGAVAAWASSPARALLAQMSGAAGASVDFDALIAKMTVEEKAGQVTLMAAAWQAARPMRSIRHRRPNPASGSSWKRCGADGSAVFSTAMARKWRVRCRLWPPKSRA